MASYTANLIEMMNGLQRKLGCFDVRVLASKCKNHEIPIDQVKKLMDDVYQLEEDLIIMDCETHSRT